MGWTESSTNSDIKPAARPLELVGDGLISPAVERKPEVGSCRKKKLNQVSFKNPSKAERLEFERSLLKASLKLSVSVDNLTLQLLYSFQKFVRIRR